MLKQQIYRNRVKTVFIVIIFLLIYTVVVGAFGYFITEEIEKGIVLGILVGGIYALYTLARSKSNVLKMSSGREIKHKSRAPQLWNIVEEMSLASGIPMPRIYIVDSFVPNAFVAGLSRKRVAVGVTQGLLDILNREEIEAVIAHEFAHIQNNDMVLSTIIASFVASVTFISMLRYDRIIKLKALKNGGSKDKGNGYLMLGVFIIIMIGAIFTKMSQLSLSRNREYLADATAIDITRNPEGLRRALLKINKQVHKKQGYGSHVYGYSVKGRPYTQGVDERMAGLYFVNPLTAWDEDERDSVWQTHPNTYNRVKRIDKMM